MLFDKIDNRLNGFDDIYQKKIYERLRDASPRQTRINFANHLTSIVVFLGAIMATCVCYYLNLFELALIINSAAVVFFILLVKAIFVVPQDIFNLKEINSIFLPDLCKCFGLSFDEHPEGDITFDFAMLGAMDGFEPSYVKYGMAGMDSGFSIEVNYGRWRRQFQLIDPQNKEFQDLDGLLIKVSFPKEVKGRTYIFSNSSLMGNFRSPETLNCQRVYLECPEFEEQHLVYSTDQVEARYILTPSFMDRISSLQRINAVGDFRIAISSKGVFIFLVNVDGFFNGSCYRLTSENFIKFYIHNISTIFKVVDMLELEKNTKI